MNRFFKKISLEEARVRDAHLLWVPFLTGTINFDLTQWSDTGKTSTIYKYQRLRFSLVEGGGIVCLFLIRIGAS